MVEWMRTFVVSLPGSPRRDVVSSRLKIPFDFSDGVLLPLERVEYLRAWMRNEFPDLEADVKTRLSQGSLGTLLAHLRVFRRVAEQDEPFCLVLEDDCVVNPAFDLSLVDWDALHAAHGRPMFLFLHRCAFRYGLVAQLVTREGARFVLDRVHDLIATNVPIDLFVWHHPDVTRASLYLETNHQAWLFEHDGPVEHAPTSERVRVNRTYGHFGDLV